MKKIAAISLVLVFLLTLGFHFLVMLKVIPYTLVWGGRLKCDADMYLFELISVALTLVFLAIVLLKSGMLKSRISPSFINTALWIMASMLLLNTAGNMLSENYLERLIFTPVTLLLSGLILILATTGTSTRTTGRSKCRRNRSCRGSG